MIEEPRCLLVTPISPSEPGNGLAHRARFWQEVLQGLGPVTTVLLPLAGQPRPDDANVVRLVEPVPSSEHLPLRARRAPEHLGRAWATEQQPFDLVVALRAYAGPFALGVAAGRDAKVIVDLDDDDADLLRSLGEHAEAERFAALVAAVRLRADHLVSVNGFDGTIAVPNSVAVPETPPTRASTGNRILMVGNFGYALNVDGAQWFLDNVHPLVRTAVPDVELKLVGPGSERFTPHGSGYVQDLTDEYAQTAVAVVPLLHGSGSRIKALEAFAHRVPVVGTTTGLENLGVQDGVHCLVRDEPAAFADAVIGLLDEHSAGRPLTERAYDELCPRYARDTVLASTRVAVREVLDTKSQLVYAPADHLASVEADDGLVVLDEQTLTAHHLNALAAVVFALVERPTHLPELVDAVCNALGRVHDHEVTASVTSAAAALAAAGLLIRQSAG